MTHLKKNKLEKLRGIFFQFGLIIAGGVTLLAFEWTSPVYLVDLPKPDVQVEEPWDIIPIIPIEDKVIKPKLKEVVSRTNPDIIEIVKKDIKEVKKEVDPVDPVEPFNPNKFKTPVEEIPTDEPFIIVEKMPEMVGGLKKYLSENLKYPSKARELGSEGKVYLRFVVGKTGEIRDVEVLRGVNKWLDEEAVRVVKAMPNWEPGKQRGKAVSVVYNLPINFQLKK